MTTSIPTLCGSVSGHPSRLGLSMHNAAYAELSLDYRYVAFGTESPADVISAINLLRFRGPGGSMPFMQSVLQYLDEIHSTFAPLVPATPSSTTVVS
jgi:shikimate dehydrogenase